jgi:5-methylcytosine-specific restriction protein B
MAAPRLSIAEALERWAQASRVYAARAEAQRSEVTTRFPLEAWPTMRVEDYALGVGNPETFCRWMEFKTQDCGGIGGGSAKKHLIFRRASGEWYFQKKYASLDNAWTAVRDGFVRAFDLAASDKVLDIEGVEPLSQAPSLSGKAVYMYFPDRTLPIYGHPAQEHFWRLLSGTGNIRMGAPGARQLLDLARSRP